MSAKPNPGTPEALDLGCTCPVLDNHYGDGFVVNGERIWWRNAECPLHSKMRKKEVKK